MKRYWMIVCALAVTAAAAVYAGDEKPADEPAAKPADKPAAPDAPDAPAPVDPRFESLKARVSYGIGLNLGQSLVRQGFDATELDVDVDVLAEGLKDVLTKRDPQVSDEQLEAAMEEFQKQMASKQEEREVKQKEEAGKAKEAGEKFLAENAKKEGVKTTESGLQYQVLKQGDGAKPKATDTVKVHYKGTLLNGEEFDSSYKRGEPVTFGLDQVIPGWTEGVQLMPVGSKYKFFIPSKLGYGERGAPPRIPPHSVLVFEIELLGIEK